MENIEGDKKISKVAIILLVLSLGLLIVAKFLWGFSLWNELLAFGFVITFFQAFQAAKSRLPLILAIEALLCGGPITFVACVLLPWHFISMLTIPSYWWSHMFTAFAILVGSIIAILEFWRLAISSIYSSRYKFGLLFWVGLAGSSLGSYWLIKLWPSSIWLIALALFATGHFSYLQLRTGKSFA
jgi:hypothetical protein